VRDRKPGQTSLSVLVPVYNESHLVGASLERLKVLANSRLLFRVQVIIVDDCRRSSGSSFATTKTRVREAQSAPRFSTPIVN
jgi:hypothetical protein